MAMMLWIQRQCARFRRWREARHEERMRRFVERANRPENVERLRRENEKLYGRLVLDEGGFHLVKDEHRKAAVTWDDVRTIHTYKRDFFAYDMICLAFEVAEGEWVEIWESMVDFELVDKEMCERFPGVPRDWFGQVMQPPFAPNDRVLWRRH
jgi:hypothetical protein